MYPLSELDPLEPCNIEGKGDEKTCIFRSHFRLDDVLAN